MLTEHTIQSNDSILNWTVSTEFQLETQVQIFGAQFFAYTIMINNFWPLYAAHIMINKNIGIQLTHKLNNIPSPNSCNLERN
jgi:hypothetical protein